jgi:hypothetical protein
LATTAAAQFVPDATGPIRATFGSIVRLTGTLRGNTGQAIAGASVAATLTSAAAAKGSVGHTATTDGQGRYVFLFRATSSRLIRLTHPASGAAYPQALTVRSKLKLRAARSHVAPLGRMRLIGSLPTERTRRGASVAIKVRSGRRWRTVGVVRASTRGAFRFSYRFRRTRHARLRFRAAVVRSSDLAVSASASKPVTVRVG